MGNWNAVRFGEELRRWRTARDMNQSDVARLVGAARNTVSRWEVGDFLPGPVQLRRLEEVMGADFPVLLTPAQAERVPEDLHEVLAEARSALDTALREAFNAWYRTYPPRILAAAQGEAPPADLVPPPLEDDSDAIEATAMRALLEADQAAAAATPAPPAAAPRAASGTRSRRPR